MKTNTLYSSRLSRELAFYFTSCLEVNKNTRITENLWRTFWRDKWRAVFDVVQNFRYYVKRFNRFVILYFNQKFSTNPVKIFWHNKTQRERIILSDPVFNGQNLFKTYHCAHETDKIIIKEKLLTSQKQSPQSTAPFKMFGPFWSVWCKMALVEVGASLPWWWKS